MYTVAQAERWTRKLARSHYENFLVVSWLLPRHLHQPMFNIYAYCRGVDDLGDEAEGDRLALLDGWQRELGACYGGKPEHPAFVALAPTIRQFDLPIEPFQRLIEANRRDQTVTRYETYDDVLDYCRYSANPVGRLVLMLFGYRDEERFALSDATCTALQLANFWQDVARDYKIGRIYLPLEDMHRFGCSEAQIASGTFDARFRALMEYEVERTRELFDLGAQLVPLVQRRLQVDLRLFTLGGMEVLNRIEAQGYDVLTKRPVVSGWRQAALLVQALCSALNTQHSALRHA
ncbi:MAG TPA: squalene synthase HpnC [Chloroflexota bacterium]|nr:squalene synthase HpnC [Chloroflexota bacterium]